VHEYRQSRESAEHGAAEPGLSGARSDPDFMWRPGWLPILPGGQLKTAIDCDVAEGEPSPVSFIDVATQPEEYACHKARSFGELIVWWCIALERGAWQWDAEGRRWHEDARRLPAELQGSPLV
jgi:cell wall assembly regulator SMI1